MTTTEYTVKSTRRRDKGRKSGDLQPYC